MLRAMALMSCPDCGNEVSTQAMSCPKCGRQLRLPKRTFSAAGCLVITILVLLLLPALWFTGCGGLLR